MVAPAKPLFDVDLNRDVRALEAMTEAETLKRYLYGTELYGHLQDSSLPKLTLGGVLMRLHRLTTLWDRLTPAQQHTIQTATQSFEALRAEWAVHYEAKLLHELKSRQTALGQFLVESEENPRTARENYPSAIEKRVMLELLQDEAERLGVLDKDLKGSLTSLDNRIHRIAEKVDYFIWDSRVEGAYPRDKFWFLYLLPPQKKS